MTTLERRYRRLLAVYPAAYRAARADEIVDTYLAGAAPGRRWPTPADAADLVAGGLGERLRANRSGGLAAGARLAASLSLVAAVVLAGVWLLWIEIEP